MKLITDTYKNEKVSGIYMLVNRVNQKKYIGQSINIADRIRSHFTFRSKETKKIYNALKKYTPELFDVYILENTSEDNLTSREQHWLNHYQTYENERGYNILRNARNSLGYKHSEETKRKMREAHKKRDTTGSNNSNYGNKMSKEAKERISKANTGYTSHRKPVDQIDKDTGEIIKRWNSASEASRELGIDYREILRAAGGSEKKMTRGKLVYRCFKGYRWRYPFGKVVGRCKTKTD